tara:strand:- start:521 stop:1393 length:873 start_codon:yes stop_codon:yes gene_type:complete
MIIKNKPLLKWAGGKSSLNKIIEKYYINLKFDRYIEPFFGGGAVFFNIINKFNIEKRDLYINDANKDLIQLYKHIKSKSSSLIKEYEKVLQNYAGEKDYYRVRDLYNARDINISPLMRSSLLMLLNKTCFNGLYRVNSKGEFNVPVGRYANASFIKSEQISQLSKVLPPSRNITSKDYKEVIIKRNDLVYFDPPYVPLNETSYFTDYSVKFGLEQQKDLADYFKLADSKGAYVIASNSNTKIVRDLYRGFKIIPIDASRNINSVASKRKKIKELLIIGNKTLDTLVTFKK